MLSNVSLVSETLRQKKHAKKKPKKSIIKNKILSNIAIFIAIFFYIQAFCLAATFLFCFLSLSLPHFLHLTAERGFLALQNIHTALKSLASASGNFAISANLKI